MLLIVVVVQNVAGSRDLRFLQRRCCSHCLLGCYAVSKDIQLLMARRIQDRLPDLGLGSEDKDTTILRNIVTICRLKWFNTQKSWKLLPLDLERLCPQLWTKTCWSRFLYAACFCCHVLWLSSCCCVRSASIKYSLNCYYSVYSQWKWRRAVFVCPSCCDL